MGGRKWLLCLLIHLSTHTPTHTHHHHWSPKSSGTGRSLRSYESLRGLEQTSLWGAKSMCNSREGPSSGPTTWNTQATEPAACFLCRHRWDGPIPVGWDGPSSRLEPCHERLSRWLPTAWIAPRSSSQCSSLLLGPSLGASKTAHAATLCTNYFTKIIPLPL